MPEALTQAEQAQVCEFLGIPSYEAPIFDDDGPIAGCVCTKYPNLLTWEGFGLMVEALAKLDIGYDLVRWEPDKNCRVKLYQDIGFGPSQYAANPSEALARAVLALAKEKS